MLGEKDRLEGMYEWEKCKAKIDGMRCFCGGFTEMVLGP
jgi:hypothetical protein